MYKTRYSIWDEKEFPGFTGFLSNLYNTSMNNFYKKTVKEEKYDKKEIKQEASILEDYIKDIEYYYVSLLKLGFITKQNYDNVLKQLESLHYIKVFPKNQRSLYGLSNYNPRHIVINPDLKPEFGFSIDCVRQMCISHELGHIINMSWWRDAREYGDELYNDPRVRTILKNMNLDDPKYLKYGFSLLDEVVVQEAAEAVTYRMANKPRPSKEYRTDKAIFKHNPYLTNYALYGELQEFAIKFARSLDFVNTESTDTDQDVLTKLARRSFDKNFISRIKYEIDNNTSKKDNLIIMLACMGSIKAATYKILNLEKDERELDTMMYTDSFNKAAKSTIKR